MCRLVARGVYCTQSSSGCNRKQITSRSRLWRPPLTPLTPHRSAITCQRASAIREPFPARRHVHGLGETDSSTSALAPGTRPLAARVYQRRECAPSDGLRLGRQGTLSLGSSRRLGEGRCGAPMLCWLRGADAVLTQRPRSGSEVNGAGDTGARLPSRTPTMVRSFACVTRIRPSKRDGHPTRTHQPPRDCSAAEGRL